MKRIFSIVAALCFLSAQSLDAQRLTILHTNDTHSHIDPQRGGRDDGKLGVIERAAFIDSVRTADGRRNVLLLDAGDFDQGSSYFTVLGGRRYYRMSTQVQTFGRKKTATAVAHVTKGRGEIRVNGVPLELVRPEILRSKVEEPLQIAGGDKLQKINIRIRVNGGGYVAQIYAIRQAISKALVAYYANSDEECKNTLRESFIKYDRSLIVADPRRAEAKKFGGRGARARRQKSYR